MNTIIDGELVDTYEGHTWRDVWYELEDGKYTFYERCYGNKPSPTEEVTDAEDILHYLSLVENKFA